MDKLSSFIACNAMQKSDRSLSSSSLKTQYTRVDYKNLMFHSIQNKLIHKLNALNSILISIEVFLGLYLLLKVPITYKALHFSFVQFVDFICTWSNHLRRVSPILTSIRVTSNLNNIFLFHPLVYYSFIQVSSFLLRLFFEYVAF